RAFQLQRHNRGHHDLTCPEQKVERTRPYALAISRRADHIDGNDDICLAVEKIEGYRIGNAAIDQDATVATHGPEKCWKRHRCRQRREQFPPVKYAFAMAV